MNAFDLQTSWVLEAVLLGLQKAGVLQYLAKAGEHLTVSEIVKAVTIKDNRSLDEALSFVSLLYPELLECDQNGAYKLTHEYHTDSFQNLLHFSLAYKPVMEHVGELLAGKMSYGQDIVRDGLALGISSEHYTTSIVGTIGKLIQKEGAVALVDLGCGSGHMARRLSTSLNCEGIGIDTQQPVEVTGFKFIKGDVSQPQSWINELPKTKLVFVAAYVWHEFLYESVEELNKIWTEYRRLFPGSIMYMIEYDGKKPEALKLLSHYQRNATAVYQLMHPFTKQGYPRGRKEWQQVIHECNLPTAEEYATDAQSTIYRIVF